SDDILQIVPNPEERLDQVEDMLDELREARVPVVDEEPRPAAVETETPPAAEEAAVDEAAVAAKLWEDGPTALSPDEPEGELEPIADYEQEGIDDPVGMSLREIGRVYLLTAEDERRLAKRMEEGKVIREVREALQNQLSQFPPADEVLVRVYDRLRQNWPILV